MLCCGRAKGAAGQADEGDAAERHLRLRRSEPWQDTLRCVDPVTGALTLRICSCGQ